MNWPHGEDQNSNFSKRHEGIFGSEDAFLVLGGLDSAQVYEFVYVCEVLGVRRVINERWNNMQLNTMFPLWF